MLKNKIIPALYRPVCWGIKNEAGELEAFIQYKRDSEITDYSEYGDDADLYEKFEEDGFCETKTMKDLKSAYEWLKENTEER